MSFDVEFERFVRNVNDGIKYERDFLTANIVFVCMCDGIFGNITNNQNKLCINQTVFVYHL